MRTGLFCVLLLASLPACGGSAVESAPPNPPAPVGARGPAPASAFVPDEVVVASTEGRLRSLQPLVDGRWFVSRLLGPGAVPGILAAGGDAAGAATIASLEGWTASDVLALRASPDGSQVAFTRVTDPAHPEVWVRPVSGGEGRRIVAGFLLNWLPDGASVLVLSGTGATFATANLDLVEVASGTSRTVVPAMEGFLFRGAAASPDGQSTAFLRYPAASAGVLEPSNVFVVPSAGGAPRQLTTDSAGCLDLAWTPDGTHVLHSAQRGADRDVWAVPVAGGPVVRIAGTPAEDGVPTVSPDGQRLRYASYEGSHAKLMLFEAARGGPPRVVSEGDADRLDPALAPDGFRIAYVVASGNASNLVIGRVDDGSTRALTETPEPEANPTWAPDGSSLAYLSPRAGKMEIVLHLFRAADEPSSPLRVGEPALTHDADAVPTAPLRFSSDGRFLLYLARRAGVETLMRLPVGGGEPIEVVREPLSYAWDPRQAAILVVRAKRGGGTELVRLRPDTRRPAEVVRADVSKLQLLTPAADGNVVYALERADRVQVVQLDLATGRRTPLVVLPENVDPLRLAVDVSHDGRFVAGAVGLASSQVREMRNFGAMRR